MKIKGNVVVAGGGASGMMAAITAARAGADVVLLEPNEKVGRKLYITGKGRCNVTNHCNLENLMAAIPRNGKFLYSAFSRFAPTDTMAFFEGLGVKLKTERGNRVFPCSDKAADIVDALFFELRRQGVEVRRDRVTGLSAQDGQLTGIRTENGGSLEGCGALILATGGASYPRTGSTGDGYGLAQSVGHTIKPIRGSLVPLESDDPCCGALQGLSLRNVELNVKNEKGKTVFREQGELLFTHFGLSGPLALSASAHMDVSKHSYTAHIDLKPALDEQKLDARLLRDFEARANQDYANALGGLVPRSMVSVLVERTGIPGDTKVHDIRKEQRRRLLETLKSFTIPLSGTRPVEEAVITAGGVAVGEVDPKTMESKKAKGLFIAGELLDVDAYTGGFNLQIAWATGYAAGLAAAERASNI
ncbi:MAG: NAD(P)/FAD-dependent oxidoreductase [Oscillospiraceae bacterium]|nr:NAD(P)/FAD-dependent oxidoreductase [Oscillospiraceae bacterium]MDE7170981.1 NAD(P)/FAD-dependent oxidoreductase [Oscillospiraceae bacterium]